MGRPEKEVVMHTGTPPKPPQRPWAVLEEERSLAGEGEVPEGKFPNFPTSGCADPAFYFML